MVWSWSDTFQPWVADVRPLEIAMPVKRGALINHRAIIDALIFLFLIWGHLSVMRPALAKFHAHSRSVSGGKQFLVIPHVISVLTTSDLRVPIH